MEERYDEGLSKGSIDSITIEKAETKADFSSQVSYVVAFSICSLLMCTKRLSV